MHERKAGTLRSGGSGKKVTSRKQAIAHRIVGGAARGQESAQAEIREDSKESEKSEKSVEVDRGTRGRSTQRGYCRS